MGLKDSIINLFSEEKLASAYLDIVKRETPGDVRPVFDDEEPKSSFSFDSLSLFLLFGERYKSIWEKDQVQSYDFMDVFEEQALFDIIELCQAGHLQFYKDNILKKAKELSDMLKKAVKKRTNLDAEELLEQFDSGKINEDTIETEEQLDALLLAMLSYKLDNNGRTNLKYCSFVIDQCFDQNSLIMKNKEKYKNVVYRFLEDFAKEDAIRTQSDTEKNLNRGLSTIIRVLQNKDTLVDTLPFTKEDKKESFDGFGNNLDGFENIKIDNNAISEYEVDGIWKFLGAKDASMNLLYGVEEIIRDTEELIRTGWIFSKASVAKYAKILELLGPNSKEGKALSEVLSRAYCSDRHDNSTIVALTDEGLGENVTGSYVNKFVRINPSHAEKLIYSHSNDEKLSVLGTIFHENTHDSQFRDYGDVRNFFRYVQQKIGFLIKTGVVDYDEIYFKEELTEREAFLEGAKKSYEYAITHGLNVNFDALEENIKAEEDLIREFFDSSFSIRYKDEGTQKKGGLSSLFEKKVLENIDTLKRRNKVRAFGMFAVMNLVKKSALQKYINDPKKEIAIEDYAEGVCVLNDCPSLRIEYADDGHKRSYEEFLKNAKSLVSKQRFLGSSSKSRIVVNRDLLRLIKDINDYEYMDFKNLPEIIYGLCNEDVAFDKEDKDNKNDLYKGFIKELTSKSLPELIKKVKENISLLDKDDLELICNMCALLRTYRGKPEEVEKRKEFFEGMDSVDEETGMTVFELLESLEEKAKEKIGPGNSEQGNNGRKPGGIGLDD